MISARSPFQWAHALKLELVMSFQLLFLSLENQVLPSEMNDNSQRTQEKVLLRISTHSLPPTMLLSQLIIFLEAV